MANEIQISSQGSVVSGALHIQIPPYQMQADLEIPIAHETVVSVGTSEEDMPVGDVQEPGVLILQNLDIVNYVAYGPKDTTMTEFGRLNPGERHVLRLAPSGVTLRWVADTSPVLVKMLLLESIPAPTTTAAP